MKVKVSSSNKQKEIKFFQGIIPGVSNTRAEKLLITFILLCAVINHLKLTKCRILMLFDINLALRAVV